MSTSRVADFFQPAYPTKARKLSSTRRNKLVFSYAPDWILTLVLAGIFLSLDKIDGFRRVFSLDDTSLRHPFAVHERVPDTLLYIICGVAPLVILPIINFFTVRSWWDFHNSWLGLILGLSLTGSVTQFVKITVGRPRPDVLARCLPPAGSVNPPFQLVDSSICTQTDVAILRDGFRSFPSGHSSMSFAGLGFLSFYLAGKMHLFDRRGHTGKAWLALSPFCIAALVAISRTMDYRHHWHDVLVGSLVGTFLSYFSYRQYYPSLTSDLSHRPYSPRIKELDDGSAPVLPMHGSAAESSAFDKPAAVPLSNRYSPSPPPSHHHQSDSQSYGYAPNQFVHGRPGNGEYTEVAYELSGTVPRPGQEGLHEPWKRGLGVDGTVPRSGGVEDEGDTSYEGYPQRQQQAHVSSGLA